MSELDKKLPYLHSDTEYLISITDTQIINNIEEILKINLKRRKRRVIVKISKDEVQIQSIEVEQIYSAIEIIIPVEISAQFVNRKFYPVYIMIKPEKLLELILTDYPHKINTLDIGVGSEYVTFYTHDDYIIRHRTFLQDETASKEIIRVQSKISNIDNKEFATVEIPIKVATSLFDLKCDNINLSIHDNLLEIKKIGKDKIEDIQIHSIVLDNFEHSLPDDYDILQEYNVHILSNIISIFQNGYLVFYIGNYNYTNGNLIPLTFEKKYAKFKINGTLAPREDTSDY